MRLVDHVFQGANHRWMRRFVKVRDTIIAAVDRQQVLDQIVGPDAEEIAAPCQQIRGHRGARDLDHRADVHIGIKRLSARP